VGGDAVARYLAEGDTGLQPRSRRPLTSPHRTSAAVEDEIVAIRKGLDRGGCGDDRVSSRAASRPQPGGLDDLADLERTRVVIPQPRKRPRSSYLSFAAEQPNPDAAGWTHEFLTWLVGQRLSYSVGFTLPDSFAAALQTMPSVS
jgi:hypothetical protein